MKERDRQASRQTDRQADRQTDRDEREGEAVVPVSSLGQTNSRYRFKVWRYSVTAYIQAKTRLDVAAAIQGRLHGAFIASARREGSMSGNAVTCYRFRGNTIFELNRESMPASKSEKESTDNFHDYFMRHKTFTQIRE